MDFLHTNRFRPAKSIDARIPWKQQNLILLLPFVLNHHWVLLIYYVDASVIEVWDSLGTCSIMNQIQDNIKKWRSREIIIFNNPTKDKSLQPTGSRDCGIYACLFGWKRAFLNVTILNCLKTPHSDIVELRKK